MRAYIHLSDTHFGSKGVDEVLPRLKELIEAQLATFKPDTKVSFIVTGDGVDSPTPSNGAQFLAFSDYLAKKSGREPLVVLGNHDVNYRGLAFGDSNQTLANYVGRYPRLKRVDDIGVIFILFNSNVDGIFAQGKIGRQQMEAAAALLAKVKNLSDYTLIAVLHHHVAPVPQARAPLPSFWKKLAPRWLSAFLITAFVERTMRLTDAKAFVSFLKEHQVSFILHGHKHVPFITQHEGISVIACGSSTRREAAGDSGLTCISYNVLTFDESILRCDQYAEYVLGAGVEGIGSATFNL
ncbi:MAG: metallophosphoesterase [Coriobacteriia bacterium]|nr:metallophosphoesterase [Coriobacteriia bacterium]